MNTSTNHSLSFNIEVCTAPVQSNRAAKSVQAVQLIGLYLFCIPVYELLISSITISLT